MFSGNFSLCNLYSFEKIFGIIQMESNFDLKGIMEVGLLLVFGITLNDTLYFIKSITSIDSLYFFEIVFEYSIKFAVLITAILKARIEYRKYIKNKND